MEILLFLLVLLGLITIVGHIIWLILAALGRLIFGSSKKADALVQTLGLTRCLSCNQPLPTGAMFCAGCGLYKPTEATSELMKDLAATERQILRFRHSGIIDLPLFETLKTKLATEQARLLGNVKATETPTHSDVSEDVVFENAPPSVTVPVNVSVPPPVAPPPSAVSSGLDFSSSAPVVVSAVADEPDTSSQWPSEPAKAQTPPSRPRKPFTEVIAAFMEESNIRWGEVKGGLLIIGFSTALVVSLWAEISRIPVLKFLIFTTVTAAFFGVGLYTHHRWKLPTTSFGILTISTLLVPLNFLAIAAVSSSTLPPGLLVIVSELVAPALFLCLVYFAARVITPAWPQLLAAGVLGSSIGQLLVRHFVSVDTSPTLLVAIAAFPLGCYVAGCGWMLLRTNDQAEIGVEDTIPIFITLGALTFSTALPFFLLLYKAGPLWLTMMYLAPLVSVGGLPALATGMMLWQRVNSKDLLASRVAGTALAVVGLLLVFTGIVLAWPNPASIVPAALLNFAVFTGLAGWLRIPRVHFPASLCLGLAYLVFFQVIGGNVSWLNLRVASLLEVTVSISSGQALVGLALLFVIVSEWLASRRAKLEGEAYLGAAVLVAVFSLALVTRFGLGLPGDPHWAWMIYAVFAVGAFWLAARWKVIWAGWAGSVLLLAALAQATSQWLELSFPWQTSMLVHASLSAAAAIMSSVYASPTDRRLTRPLNLSALITSLIAVLCLVQAWRWETTEMQAERFFWLAGIWFVSLWLNRRRDLFMVFQVAVFSAAALAIKATLQQYDWYAYLPHAFLHPWSLQIQGTVAVLLCLASTAVRLRIQSVIGPPSPAAPAPTQQETGANWRTDAVRLLDARFAFDRLALWVVLGGFSLLTIYGAWSGVAQELTAADIETHVWNIAGFPHQYAFGVGSWIVLGLLAIAMVANSREGRRTAYLLGAVAALTTLSPLLAGRFEAQLATASAWRWLAAMLLALAWLPIWFRTQLGERFKFPGWSIKSSSSELMRRMRRLLLFTSIAPILILTIYPALRAIYYMPVHGPAAGFFSLFDDDFSYSVPLMLVSVVLIAFALRERLPGYAFASGLIFNLTVTMTYLLSVAAVHDSMNRVVLAHTIQINAIASAVFVLLWTNTHRRWQPQLADGSAVAQRLLRIQIGIALLLNAMLLVPVTVKLFFRPDLAGLGTVEAGAGRGWIAWALTTIAAASYGRIYNKRIAAGAVSWVLLGVGCLTAFTAARWETENWAGFHALMASTIGVAWLLGAGRWLPAVLTNAPSAAKTRLRSVLEDNWEANTGLKATSIGALSIVLALRAPLSDPSGSVWSVGTLLLACGLAAVLNWQTLRRRYLYAAGLLLNIAVSISWLANSNGRGRAADFIVVNVAALSLTSILWLWLELRSRRLRQRDSAFANLFSFHNVGAIGSLIVMAGIVWLSLLLEVARLGRVPQSPETTWLAILSLVALMTATTWDREAKYSTCGLYLSGLVAAGAVLDRMDLAPHRLVWSGAIILAGYGLATSLLWRGRETILRLTDQFRIPRRIEAETVELKWLSVLNLGLTAAVVFLAIWVVLRFLDWTPRVTVACAVVSQAAMLALLAEGRRRRVWQRASVTILLLGLVLAGWAALVPGTTGTWLNRAVILMVEMFAVTLIYSLSEEKGLALKPDWTRATRACLPYAVSVGAIALVLALLTEVYYQIAFGAVRINSLALVAIGATLIAIIVMGVLFALSPKHDPLKLSEAGRMKYVYVAEVTLALLFMHIRLTMPWLFTGFFERYWPFVIMAVAYLGVTASEGLRRRKVLVLARPIERTGAFLPLLPVIGFWVIQSEVDYSALLFLVGGIYGLLSILRQSFAFGLLAAIAGNGGLWYMLERTQDYGFRQHPQLWFIPAALSVLIAAYLNREQLTESQLTRVRYLSLAVVYASSSADIFINGAANSPWLPLILGALSLAGVFAGIGFRIRGLLLLGSVFLLFSIVTMIYYASVNFGWTWLWYVAGIVTGATIIFMFAVFEKKRSDVLRLVEGLREWER